MIPSSYTALFMAICWVVGLLTGFLLGKIAARGETK